MSEYELDFEPSSSLRPEHKAKWLTALRSGDYKQGQNRLRTAQDEYCCLGVLCEILKDEINGAWELHGGRYTFVAGAGRIGRESSGLPPVLVHLTGVASLGHFNNSTKRAMNASLSWASSRQSLSDLNDTGSTFAEIADVIEKYF